MPILKILILGLTVYCPMRRLSHTCWLATDFFVFIMSVYLLIDKRSYRHKNQQQNYHYCQSPRKRTVKKIIRNDLCHNYRNDRSNNVNHFFSQIAVFVFLSIIFPPIKIIFKICSPYFFIISHIYEICNIN